MSELMNEQSGGNNIRHRLLATVSSIALLITVYSAKEADASDAALASGGPPVWIEIGGQFDTLNTDEEIWMPPLNTPASGHGGFVRKAPSVGSDLDASISFQPDGGAWVYSASIRYGRALRNKSFQTQVRTNSSSLGPLNIYHAYTALGRSEATHAILDFQAGKDVGLGMFSFSGNSVVKFGIRFVQFSSQIEAYANDFPAQNYMQRPRLERYLDSAEIKRSAWAVGPSLSWDASARLTGGAQRGFAFDWGATGALLFGRQKAQAHIVSVFQMTPDVDPPFPPPFHSTVDTLHTRNKQMIVPNIGGFAGFSLRWPAAKISIGYRGDFFFGAMDGGIAARKNETMGFYGPFASISIGIGG